MKKFRILRKVREVFEVEAESLDAAIAAIQGGDVESSEPLEDELTEVDPPKFLSPAAREFLEGASKQGKEDSEMGELLTYCIKHQKKIFVEVFLDRRGCSPCQVRRSRRPSSTSCGGTRLASCRRGPFDRWVTGTQNSRTICNQSVV